MASKLEFIFPRRAVTAYNEMAKHQKVKSSDDVILLRSELEDILKQEEKKDVFACKMKKDGTEGAKHRQSYRDIWLIDGDFYWRHQYTDKKEFSWDYLCLRFFFPKSNIIRIVFLKTCIGAFSKAQRINIMSYVKHHLKERGYDLKKARLPNQYKPASTLVGAAMQDVSHLALMESYLNPDKYREGWIYSEANPKGVYSNVPLHHINDRPDMSFALAQPGKKIFFPSVSNLDSLAYDCLPKTINQALGF